MESFLTFAQDVQSSILLSSYQGQLKDEEKNLLGSDV